MNDLISRREAIKEIDNLPNCYNGYSDTYDKAYIIGVLEELPSVEPKKVVEDYCRPRNLMVVAAEDFHRFEEPKKGKWIYLDGLDAFECSVCGRQMVRNIFNYCPWCGARMERSEE